METVRRRETPTRKLLLSSIYILFTMSDYTLENRETVVNTLVSRVIENAPLREIIRVYSEAVQAAGYQDILEAFEIEVPPAPEETPVSETEVA